MKYILTGKKTPAKVVFNYDLNGFITAFEVEGITDEDQLRFLFWNSKFPFPYVQQLTKEVVASNFFNVQIIPDDLSFERFWETYNYKVSKKKAKSLWEKLSKANKIKALLHLPKYENYLKRKNIEKAYPDTYLRNEKFEDEY